MTLINSCYPKSFLHLILLLSTVAITATTIPGERQLNVQLKNSRRITSSDGSMGRDNPQSFSQATRDSLLLTIFRAHDSETSDNKKSDGVLFDLKTDVKKLFSHSDASILLRRRRRDVTEKTITTTESATSTSTTTTRANHDDDESMKISENLILNLSFGNLTSFHVNFTKSITDRIEAVNLSHNALMHFDSRKLTKLKVLDLSNNKLNGSYVLVGHELLHTLDVSFNSLSSFNCTRCEDLTFLNLSHNQLTNISLVASGESQHPLQLLDLSSNELNFIDPHLFSDKSNLSDVILSCNRMRIINKDLFRQLRGLRRLDLSFNDISVVENEAFEDLVNLHILDLSYNRLHVASLEALRALTSIARLSLAGNAMLRNALRGFAVTWSIAELDYSHVGLCQVPDSLAQSARILNLYGNFLNTICSGDFDSYPLLHKLILSRNNLSSVEDDALGRLEMLTVLHLDNNLLTQIPQSLPASLMKLFIQANHIIDIRSEDLAHLNNLELLDLSHNRLIYMPQLALPSLITLSVKMNKIENVRRQMLKTCPNLRYWLNEGNPIKCVELLELGEICIDDSTSLNIVNFNDDIDYNQNDTKREEMYLNSKSYFYRYDDETGVVGGLHKCQKQRPRTTSDNSNFTADDDVDGMETLPNCWSEKEKLITSLILTNDSTSTTTAPTSTASISLEDVRSGSSETAASNDNKFTQQTTVAAPLIRQSSDYKTAPSSERDRKMSAQFTTEDEESGEVIKVKTKGGKSSSPTTMTSEKMRNSKATKQTKKDKLAISLVRKRLESNESRPSLSSKDDDAPNEGSLHNDGEMENHSHIRALIAQIENPQLVTESMIINRNLIDAAKVSGSVDADYHHHIGTTTVIQSNSELISTNKIKAIKDNDVETFVRLPASGDFNSIDIAHKPAKLPSESDNKSRNELPLLAGISQSHSGSLEATDHHQQQRQHQPFSPINHTMEKWNDIRTETINHPGLLVVITASVGCVFIFVVVYVYRCDSIKSARLRNGRHRNGSFESITEGRDVLNDNFNEETRSFTIESYSNSSRSGSMNQRPSVINQNDLLPMDVLNSSISGSALDPPPHISMHLW